MLTAIDGDINGGGAGKFQIKIWDKDDGDTSAYDYLMGAPGRRRSGDIATQRGLDRYPHGQVGESRDG